MPHPHPAIALLERITSDLGSLVGLLGAGSSPDAGLIAAVESAGRVMDAARVRVAAPVARDPRAAEPLGYANPVAAVAAIAQVSLRTARARLAIAAAVSPDLSICGAPLPAERELLGQALDYGRIGLEAGALIVRELDGISPRVEPEVLRAVEAVMVNLASGRDARGEMAVIPVSVDYLASEVRQVAAAADPDGALPQEQRAARGRRFRIGRPDEDGLVPMNGRLLPDIALLLGALVEADRRSVRFVEISAVGEGGEGDKVREGGDVYEGDNAYEGGRVREGENAGDADHLGSRGDLRTSDQRRHDAFAAAIIAASRSDGAPELNGEPVTVLVTTTREQLEAEDGLAGDPIGTMAGSDIPVSRAELERFIDANGYREVRMTARGRVIGLTSRQRCFTAAQRLAIAARDGMRCATPGCSSSHLALQAHHVVAWRDRGPTSVDNGILLCYDCHRTVDDGVWSWRMVEGLPEVRGPGIPEWTRLRPPLRRAA